MACKYKPYVIPKKYSLKVLIEIITTNEIVNKLSKSFSNTPGKIMHNIAIYTRNIIAIVLKIFSDDFKIFSISDLSLLAIGLKSIDLITGPNPASNIMIKLKNCVIDVTKPLILEPYVVIINFGIIKPEIIVTICKIIDDIILIKAFLLLITFLFFYFY